MVDEAQPGIKITRRNINNLRYADDTTLTAESKEELGLVPPAGLNHPRGPSPALPAGDLTDFVRILACKVFNCCRAGLTTSCQVYKKKKKQTKRN